MSRIRVIASISILSLSVSVSAQRLLHPPTERDSADVIRLGRQDGSDGEQKVLAALLTRIDSAPRDAVRVEWIENTSGFSVRRSALYLPGAASLTLDSGGQKLTYSPVTRDGIREALLRPDRCFFISAFIASRARRIAQR